MAMKMKTNSFDQTYGDIECLHTMLDEQKKSLGEKSMKKALQTQFHQVRQRIEGLAVKQMDGKQKSMMQSLVLAGPWLEEQKEQLMEMLCSNVASPESSSASGGKQNVECFGNYLTQSDVAKLQSSELSLLAKVQVLADRCLAVGIVRPSEQSYRPIMAAGIAAGISMTVSERIVYVEALKNAVRTGAQNIAKPVPYITDYPINPMDLPESLRGDQDMNCLDAGLAMSARRSVDLRRSAKSQKLQLAVAMPPKLNPDPLSNQNPMMANLNQPQMMTSGNPLMTQMMHMFQMAAQMQQHMAQMQNLTGMSPQRAPGDVVLLQPHLPKTPQPPQPALFDTGDDLDQSPEESGPLDLAIAPTEKKQGKGMKVREQGQVVEKALQSRQMKKPAAAVEMKKPAAAKPQAKGKAVAKNKGNIKQTGLVMTRNAVHSRAYKSALLRHSKSMKIDAAKAQARKDAQIALKKAGFKIKD